MAHTPAPWTVETVDDYGLYRLLEAQERQENWPEDEHGELLPGFDEEDVANARLMGAAPELLDALKQACSLMPLGTAKRAKWMELAGAAIAKAEGR